MGAARRVGCAATWMDLEIVILSEISPVGLRRGAPVQPDGGRCQGAQAQVRWGCRGPWVSGEETGEAGSLRAPAVGTAGSQGMKAWPPCFRLYWNKPHRPHTFVLTHQGRPCHMPVHAPGVGHVHSSMAPRPSLHMSGVPMREDTLEGLGAGGEGDDRG